LPPSSGRHSTLWARRAAVMVTHDPHIAAYADRIVFLKDGAIVDETRLDAQNIGNAGHPVQGVE